MKTKTVTSKRAVLLGITTLMLLGLFATPTVFALGDPVEFEITWGNDELWEMLAPLNSRSAISNHKAHRPLYGIAPIDPLNPNSPGHPPEIGAHDHAVAVPPDNKGTFNAIWHVYVVLPGPSAVPGPGGNVDVVLVPTSLDPSGFIPLLRAADLDSDGTLELLTSADKIELAASLGLAFLVDVEITFVCPVRPIP